MYKILIVDDEKNEREGLIRLIRRYQYDLEIHQAANGEEALKVFEQETIDILLTDIKMPFLTGMELIEEVHKRGWNPVCIIYSAYGEFEYAQNAIRLGVMQYLLKPIELEEFEKLFARIFELCKEKETRKKDYENLKEGLKSRKEEKISRQFMQFLEFNLEEVKEEMEPEFLSDLYIPFLLSGYSSVLLKEWESYEADMRRILGEDSIVINKGEAQFILLIRGQNLNGKQITQLCEKLIEMSKGQYQAEVYIVAGSVCYGMDVLKKEYLQICEQMDYQFFVSGSMYFLYSENGIAKKTSRMLPLYFEKILTYARLEDYQGMKSEFLKSFEYVEKTEGFSSIYIKHNFSEIIKKCCELLHSEERMLEIVEEIYGSNSMRQVKDAVLRLIDILSENRKKDGEDSRIVMLTKKMIQEHYGNYTLNVSSVAEELGVSAAYLSTVFKSGTGQTLVKYISQYRMEKAKELLKTSNLKIADVAEKVGYLNASYFISIFKNYVGESPAKYREKIFQNE